MRIGVLVVLVAASLWSAGCAARKSSHTLRFWDDPAAAGWEGWPLEPPAWFDDSVAEPSERVGTFAARIFHAPAESELLTQWNPRDRQLLTAVEYDKLLRAAEAGDGVQSLGAPRIMLYDNDSAWVSLVGSTAGVGIWLHWSQIDDARGRVQLAADRATRSDGPWHVERIETTGVEPPMQAGDTLLLVEDGDAANGRTLVAVRVDSVTAPRSFPPRR